MSMIYQEDSKVDFGIPHQVGFLSVRKQQGNGENGTLVLFHMDKHAFFIWVLFHSAETNAIQPMTKRTLKKKSFHKTN